MYDGPGIGSVAIGTGSGAAIGAGSLAKTGAPIALWLLVATVLLVVGLLLLRTSRRLPHDDRTR